MSKFELSPPPAHDRAPVITIVENEVVFVGPGSIAFSMTQAAALETYHRLGRVLGDASGTTLLLD